ncbi:ATP-binding cassette domain-containing protein [Methyloligella solikamskensis]|uniref:ATP-binding cassette domain-containing protein n=1 Tax=Methyloligella solikamskensis TaxID=1177756 RepID=A0ABW3J8Y4_9HYPH
MNDFSIMKTEKLTMRFGSVVAVDGVDFSIREGELRCLIGPNGAGKSTFFKLLTGQLVPSSGTVRFKKRPISGRSVAEIANAGIGIKTQVPSVFDKLSVAAGIELAAARKLPSELAKKRTEEVLERVGITALAKSHVGELAHGQRQLVELAMVVAPAPDLILLDEPAAGMTGSEVEHIGELIVELARSSAVVVVEHDMEFIQRIAQSVTVFNQGAILTEGPVEKVLADPRVQDVYLGKAAA